MFPLDKAVYILSVSGKRFISSDKPTPAPNNHTLPQKRFRESNPHENVYFHEREKKLTRKHIFVKVLYESS